MSLLSNCQRCARREHHWTVRQAEFNVGSIVAWKVQLCEPCMQDVQQAVLAALRPPTREGTTTPPSPPDGQENE